jgi:hypothetical protein
MAYPAILRTRQLSPSLRSPPLRTLQLAYPAILRTRQLDFNPELRPMADIGSPSPGPALVAPGCPALSVGWHEFVERRLRTLQKQMASVEKQDRAKKKTSAPPPAAAPPLRGARGPESPPASAEGEVTPSSLGTFADAQARRPPPRARRPPVAHGSPS